VDAYREGAGLDELVQDDDEVAVAAVTIAELLVGILVAEDVHRPGRQRFVGDVRGVVPVID
jgi:tRNA(fMet)-specific endonuclease VapC